MRTIEDKLIYGDIDNDAAEFDGISHLFTTDAAGSEAFTSATNLQIYDMGDAALSFKVVRMMLDRVRPKASVILMSRTMYNHFSQAAFEVGVASTVPIARISTMRDDYGKGVDYFDGVRILVSDYMVDEADNTGDKDDGNDSLIQSIYAIRFGQIIDGGLCLCTGGSTGGPEFYKVRELEALEDYDAAGIRLTAYAALALGSNLGAARITSIDTALAITA
jgi:hypothetical protein